MPGQIKCFSGSDGYLCGTDAADHELDPIPNELAALITLG